MLGGQPAMAPGTPSGAVFACGGGGGGVVEPGMHNGGYQEQIAYGCKMVQDSCIKRVQEREGELERLRKEADELKRQGEGLRERNHSLEAELSECRRKNQGQLEENRRVAQQVMSLRGQISKLGKFRERLEGAFVGEEADPAAYTSGGGAYDGAGAIGSAYVSEPMARPGGRY